jgi:hypothetical protein
VSNRAQLPGLPLIFGPSPKISVIATLRGDEEISLVDVARHEACLRRWDVGYPANPKVFT